MSLLCAACLSYEDIQVRQEQPDPKRYWPIIVGAEPATSTREVLLDKKCTGYRFRLTRLINSLDGSVLENTNDLYFRWFLDYSASNPNPRSSIRSFIIDATLYFPDDPVGAYHKVDVLVSDLGFKEEGATNVNWDPLDEANWDHASWYIRIVDDPAPVNDGNCIGGFATMGTK